MRSLADTDRDADGRIVSVTPRGEILVLAAGARQAVEIKGKTAADRKRAWVAARTLAKASRPAR